jgi:hypothetical protein
VVRALDAIVEFSKSTGSLTSKFSMLNLAYGDSRLLRRGKTGVGHRLPDALADDGRRIYPKMPTGGVLVAGHHPAARDTADTLGLPWSTGTSRP